MNITNTDYTSKVVGSLNLAKERVVNREHKISSDNEKLNGKYFYSQTTVKKENLEVSTVYFLESLDQAFCYPIDIMKFLNKL